MTIDDKIRREKLQNDVNRAAAKTSALLSGKKDKCEYLTGEEILPTWQHRLIEDTKFSYSPLGKALKKQVKTIEEDRLKHGHKKRTFRFLWLCLKICFCRIN